MRPRIIPSIERLRQRPALRTLEARYGRDAVVTALREEAEALRRVLSHREAEGSLDSVTSPEAAAGHLERQVAKRLQDAFRPSLRPVINATGVVVHTNLGRAPLGRGAIDRIAGIAAGYSNLEYDVEAGGRGRRDAHASRLLTRLTGAEAAIVVNNNAAATLLVLAALAAGREVLVSRGEAVEIGGGFRVPEVMAQSGAVLREVGTTNKTRAADYEAALGERTGLILRVHRSNFRIEGFTEQPTLSELVGIGRRAGIPVAEDLGSGWLGESASLPGTSQAVPGAPPSVPGASGPGRPLLAEPTIGASIQAGIDVVCFSGDKLLGGPQAGIIVGRQVLVERIGGHPLMRALRVDKLTYAALEGTLLDYLAGRALEAVPVVRMLALSAHAIRERASRLRSTVGDCAAFAISLGDGQSMVGGGSAPGIPLPTCLLALEPRGRSAADIESALRHGNPPVVARVENDHVLLDLRTVLPDEDESLVEVLKGAGRMKDEG
jgi:L-seryl-tRNA(Ser) seleniumtransferase